MLKKVMTVKTIRSLIVHLGLPKRRASGLLASGLTVAAVAIAVQHGLPLFQSRSPVATTRNAGRFPSDSSSQSRYSTEHVRKDGDMRNSGNR